MVYIVKCGVSSAEIRVHRRGCEAAELPSSRGEAAAFKV